MKTLSRLVDGAALAGSGWFLAAYAVLALIRLRYPFELEWMEGAILEQVRHVAQGQALYAEPSIAFLPFQYPPLYFYAGAALFAITGPGFAALRALSFVASLGCLWIIYSLVRRESGSVKAAVLAAGLYAACFRMAGAWYDLARIDSLCMLLVLTGAYLARFHSTPRGVVASALVLALATFAKQSAILIAIPLLAYLVIVSWRQGLVAAAVFAAVAGAGTALLNAAYHGWYVYFVFRMPARMQQIDAATVDFWRGYLLRYLPIASAMSLAYFAARIDRSRERTAWFYPCLAIGMIGSSWVSMSHGGAYDNNLMPLCAAMAILFGLAAASAEAGASAPALCLVQLLLLLYDPRAQLPAPGSRQAGRRLVATIASTPGDVLLPQHGYLAVLAGKPSFAHSMAVYDVLRAGDPKDAARLVAQFHEALASHRFAAVIVDRTEAWTQDDLEREYQRVAPAMSEGPVFWPVTGLRTRPQWIYVPRSRAPAGPLR